MLTQSRFAYLIEISQKMINSVGVMMNAYRGFPPLIDSEHEMIQSHTYGENLERVIQGKIALGEVVSKSYEDLQQLSQQLFEIWGEADCEGQGAYPGDLSNCVLMLDGIFQALSDRETGLALGVLSLQALKLKDIVAEFKSLIQKIKPKIELNRTAISQVADN
ncbi:MAG: hypothetical protein NTV34_16300, partial [Proteobacteria bacterium]|nr:hypothetical protein [Pseudomonadota bacterium]